MADKMAGQEARWMQSKGKKEEEKKKEKAVIDKKEIKRDVRTDDGSVY